MKTWSVNLKILRVCAWPDGLDPTRRLPCRAKGLPCGRQPERGYMPCSDGYKFDAIEAHTAEEAIEAAINLARLDGAGGSWFNRSLDIHEAVAVEG